MLFIDAALPRQDRPAARERPEPPSVSQALPPRPRRPLQGTLIFLRRSDDNRNVHLLGRTCRVGENWRHRLVRCEVSFTDRRMRFYALRRREPDCQPLLTELPHHRPYKPFQDK